MAWIAGKRSCWKAGVVRCTKQCRVTGGIMCMKRLHDLLASKRYWHIERVDTL